MIFIDGRCCQRRHLTSVSPHMSRAEVFLLLLDGMLALHVIPPLPQHFLKFPQQFEGTHLYSWVGRDTSPNKRTKVRHTGH